MVFGILCAAALGGGLTACGEEDPQRGQPAALDRVRLREIRHLGSERYEAINRFLETADEIAHLDNSGLTADIVYQPLLDVCRGWDDGDPLLRPLRAACITSLGFEIALADALPCAGTYECADRYDTARARLQADRRAGYRYDLAVRATRLPRACKRVLGVDENDYATARKYDRALAALQASTRSASTGDDAIAARRLARLDRESTGSSFSTSNELRRMRESCRRDG